MYIKIVGDTSKYQGKLERMGLHLIKVSGLIQHESGFRLYLDNDVMVGDYSTFIYPYLDPNLGEGIYMYSDNNMSYEEETNKPTKEEEEEQKIKNVIIKTVDEDINLLSSQVIETNEMLVSMYEMMTQIQMALVPSEETDTTNKETTTEEETQQSTEEVVDNEIHK